MILTNQQLYTKISQDRLHITSLEYILPQEQTKMKKDFVYSHNLIKAETHTERMTTKLHNLWQKGRKSIQIHKWKGIKRIEINLDKCYKMENRDVNHIGKRLESLSKEIIFFSFSLAWCSRISDEGFSRLGNQIGNHLHKLQELDIDLSLSNGITKQGLCRFVSNIGFHSLNLKKLSLIFEGCHQIINDKTIEGLMNKIATSLSCLESITLNFNKCNGASDKALVFLAKKFQFHFKKLQHISLSFEQCTWITDPGLQLFGFYIKDLKCLKSLSLNLWMCSQITDVGIEEMGNHLKTLEGLEKLMLNLCRNRTITFRSKEFLRQNFGGMEKFALYY